MPLEPDQMLSHYRLVEKLGEGGMGVVWKAEDTVLKRTVAMKVLPHAFARDRERLTRFTREARLLASLNHSNIAAIHGFEQAEGIHFLVLELATGETLAERIAARPLALDETLEIARQIAEGLEAAHERGIIHRDLKPANIQVTEEGKVKILDFGLAKAFAEEVPGRDLSQSPTVTLAGTRQGVIQGTAAYMSPDQARGKPLDKRTDLWSFGCVVYEMLTTRQAFPAATVSDTLVAILEREPDWAGLPVETPAAVRRLLRRCLVKDPNHRLHDIADARLELEEAGLESPEAASEQPPSSRRRVGHAALTGLVVGMLLGALAGFAFLRGPGDASERPVRRFSLPLPDGHLRGDFALSPDGNVLVYGVTKPVAQLFLRRLDSFESMPIPGTQAGSMPFFSPDGRWIGFFAGGQLRKVPLTGGAPVVLCDRPGGDGTWLPDDTIILGAYGTGLQRIPASGGDPETMIALDAAKEETGHFWPDLLPGGDAILFTIATRQASTPDDFSIAVLDMATGQRRLLRETGYGARYSPTGHLLFVRSGEIRAAPFDPRRHEITGPSIVVLSNLRVRRGYLPEYDFTRDGMLVFRQGSAGFGLRSLVWLAADGEEESIPTEPASIVEIRLSPDARRLAMVLGKANHELWIHDLERGGQTRIHFGDDNHGTLWTPDGAKIAFNSNREGPFQLYWQPVDGSGEAELLTEGSSEPYPDTISPDGAILVLSDDHPDTGRDLWMLPLEGDRKPEPFLQTPFDERRARFSPDGRWLAYDSDESGRPEVYVRPFPGPGGKVQISTEGGIHSVWARDGKTIFFLNGERLMAVGLQGGEQLRAGIPRVVVEKEFLSRTLSFDVAPDARFVVIKVEPEPELGEIRIVQNWFSELKRLAL